MIYFLNIIFINHMRQGAPRSGSTLSLTVSGRHFTKHGRRSGSHADLHGACLQPDLLPLCRETIPVAEEQAFHPGIVRRCGLPDRNGKLLFLIRIIEDSQVTVTAVKTGIAKHAGLSVKKLKRSGVQDRCLTVDPYGFLVKIQHLPVFSSPGICPAVVKNDHLKYLPVI